MEFLIFNVTGNLAFDYFFSLIVNLGVFVWVLSVIGSFFKDR